MPPRAQLYEPTLDVKPTGPRDPSELVHIRVPEVDLGGLGSVGKAMQIAGHMAEVQSRATGLLAGNLDKLGNQFERAGDEIFNRAVGLQELQNETEAKKAAIEYDTYENAKSVEFSNKKGDAATADSFKEHMEDLDKKRKDMAGKMANPSQKRMFENSTMNTLVSAGRRAAEHAAKETRAAAAGATDGRIATLSDKFSKTDDIKESEELFKEVHKEFWGTKVPLNGWTADEAKARWQVQTSNMYSAKITQLSHSNPQKALEMLQANKDSISTEEYTKVESTVMTNLRDRNSRNIADKIQQDMPDATYEQKIEKAKKEAEKSMPNDPKLADMTESRVTINHNQRRKEEAEEKARNYNTAKEAAYGYKTPQGKKPTVLEEARAIPGFTAAYDSLPPTEKHAIDKMLEANSKEDYPRTPETRRRVNELKAMATSERPEDRDAFMKHNFYDEKIPGEDRDALFAIQRKNLEKGYKPTTEVHKARQAAIAAGMLPDNLRTWQSPSMRNQFDGALLTAIEDKLKANKGVPLKDDEYREIISQLLANDPTTGFFGWGFTQTPRYQKMKERDPDELSQLKVRYPGLSERQLDELYSHIMWKRYNKEYEEVTTKPSTTKTSPSGKGGKPAVPISQ